MQTHLGHAAIDDKVCTVDETALITCKEQNGLCLLNGLAEAAAGEVHLTAVTLSLVVAEPVLEKWSAVKSVSRFILYLSPSLQMLAALEVFKSLLQRCRAESVESVALASMHNGQLTRHGQDSSLARRVRELRGCGPDKGDDRCSVDDGALGLVVLA